MNITEQIKEAASKVIRHLFSITIESESIAVNETNAGFEGDYTIVLFSFLKQLQKPPDTVGNAIGGYLVQDYPQLVSSYNVVKGFLNLTVSDACLLQFLQKNFQSGLPSFTNRRGEKIMVEYSSPNTNKPLHLGHLRNNFLGWSIAEILKANNNEVIKTCIVNDRGIHICKSMLAWKMFANGATPETTNTKGDHFVGDYYVKFNDAYKREVAALVQQGMSSEAAEKEAPIMKAAQQMLLDWEAGKPAVMELWNMMNSWVYKGFDETYKRIGSDFDKIYYESEAYLLGKEMVNLGLQKGAFFQKEDGSVWIDLTKEGLDEKIVRRKDGTSVYITQDIGLIINKYNEFNCNKSIYVVGDEQNYHFKVLKLIAQKLSLPSADGIYHLSYGMVELPSGKMKSREGTVVDADNMLDEMVSMAKKKTEELGKVRDFKTEELAALYETIGIGALKFFLLRVDPKKRLLFNPEESIDFHGFTGPFVQYTYARIKSILRKEKENFSSAVYNGDALLPLEKNILIFLNQFSSVLAEAVQEYDPSRIAIYVYNLAKKYNSFYSEHSVANAENEHKKILRLHLSQLTASVIKKSMHLLGIQVPERM